VNLPGFFQTPQVLSISRIRGSSASRISASSSAYSITVFLSLPYSLDTFSGHELPIFLADERNGCPHSNGTSEEIEVRDRIPAGGQTRDIDLRGGDRSINSVEFFYGDSRYRGTGVSLHGR
jgi:hypothetical protein